MRVSWNWLAELVDLSQVGGPQGLADLLTARGLEVEDLHRLDQGFEKVVAVQILERNPHPQADRLSVCKVTTGSGDPLEIVCGAQNMKAGDKVALAQVGAALPNGMKIAAGKIRGVVSNGMLCSEEELKLKDTSEGILILPAETQLGRPLAEVLGLNDTLLTLKLTANRGDCLSHFGLAREIAGALGQKIQKPAGEGLDWKGSPVSIALEAGEKAPQFLGCYIEGVKIGPSPAWVVKRLESLGARSINNIVDATNLVMFELGHPVHAYDANQIQGSKIGVRMAKAAEELPLLDGTQVKLAGSELVIFDGARSVGLAGVMGGGNSEVQDSTIRVFLECAEFDPILIRRAATAHGKRTEASHRFERGVDPEGLEAAMRRLAYYVRQFAGGKIVGSIAVRHESRSAEAREQRQKKIRIETGYINGFLGTSFSDVELTGSLEQIGCTIHKGSSEWTVTVPSHRLDLSIREDLAEEVARTQGYDKIPSSVPVLTTQPTSSNVSTVLDRAKDALAEAGLTETLNFSFTSRAWLSQFGMDSTAKLVNPMSAEHEVLVPSLLPGLVQNALTNWRHSFGSEAVSIRLFEIRPTFHATAPVVAEGEMKTNMQERWRLAFALSGPRFAGGLRGDLGEVDFFDAKAVFEFVTEKLGARGARLLAVGDPLVKAPAFGYEASLFHPGQSAHVVFGNRAGGIIGLLHPRLARELKTRAPLWLCEIDWEMLAQFARKAGDSKQFKSWSEFPSMERDFALVVKDGVTAEKITQIAVKAGKPLAKTVKVFDVYRGSQVAEGMTSVAVRVTFAEDSRSLQEAETETASQQIIAAWKKELAAELR